MAYAPIALFVYNRPRHTKQTVEFLLKNAEAEQSDLYIFSDGPKDETSEYNVKKVRDYLETIQGFKSLTIFNREKNIGLAVSIISGVTDIVHKYGNIIVLEDDLIVSPYFLEYMNNALDKYKSEDRVMQISGYMFPIDLKARTNAVFLPYTTSWGWGTWRRSWERLDLGMSGYKILNADRKLRHRFDLDGTFGYYKMLESQIAGEIDSWAIRWYLTVFMLGGLTLHPIRSLVENIGFDGSGRHCGKINEKTSHSVFRVLSFPEEVVVAEIFTDIKTYLRYKNRFLVGFREDIHGFFKEHFSKN